MSLQNDMLRHAYARGLRPPPQIDMSTWAEEAIYLSPRQPTPHPGKYRVDVTPYIRGIFAALQDKRINTVVIRKGAQTGATQAVYIALAYWVVHDPGPTLIVYPTEDNARSYSETRIMPMFEDSDVLASYLPRDRKNNWTKLQYRLQTMDVHLCGSNSPANLASRPIRYCILDEVDKYGEITSKEANPIDLAVRRTATFWNRKIVMISTPTVETGYINTHFLLGDQRQYMVACPYCGFKQAMAWPQVKFPDGVASAFYECIECQAHWTEADKQRAVLNGEWRPTTTAKIEGIASFHLPSILAPWVRLQTLVERFLRYSDRAIYNVTELRRIASLRDFVNSDLGEPWTQVVNRPQPEALIANVKPYKRGDRDGLRQFMPENTSGVVLVTVDVQQLHLVVVVREWYGEHSGLLDHTYVTTWRDVEEIANHYGAHKVAVDLGYSRRAGEVKRYCAEYSAIPMIGSDRVRGYKWVRFDPYEGTSQQGTPGDYWMLTFKPTIVKDRLWEMIGGATRWYIFSPPDRDYARQMTSEVKDGDRWRLIRDHWQNHYLDCEVMQIVLGRALDIIDDYGMQEEKDE